MSLEQTCPLCGTIAQYDWVDHGNVKSFACPHCTQFQMSKHAEKRLCTAPQQWRDEFARAALRAPDGTRLVITVPHQHEGATAQLAGDIVPVEDCRT